MGREALCWGVSAETNPRASLPGSAHGPPVPLAALLILGTSQGRKRHVAEPRRLAEGWRPPDAGYGHLLLIKGWCPSSSCCGHLPGMTTSPHLRFSWGAQSKINLSLSAKDQQNEPLVIIHVLRRLAGSWEKCCFSLPFPQIAVSVNTQHYSSVSLRRSAFMRAGTHAGACGTSDPNHFPCSVLGEGPWYLRVSFPTQP